MGKVKFKGRLQSKIELVLSELLKVSTIRSFRQPLLFLRQNHPYRGISSIQACFRHNDKAKRGQARCGGAFANREAAFALVQACDFLFAGYKRHKL